MLAIREAASQDRAAWQALWQENCAHFGAEDMSPAVVDGLWLRIRDPDFPLQAWLATSEAGAIGLAHTIQHPHTFSLRPVCCLEDLWVSPQARGSGVASALIDHLVRLGERQGWRRLYWETATDNDAARRLYDRLAKRRSVVTYQIEMRR